MIAPQMLSFFFTPIKNHIQIAVNAINKCTLQIRVDKEFENYEHKRKHTHKQEIFIQNMSCCTYF